jgi:hypothetical protein
MIITRRLFAQYLLQTEHKSLQRLAIVRLLVDVPANPADFLIGATIGFLHIPPHIESDGSL